jgi:hypothetical protein
MTASTLYLSWAFMPKPRIWISESSSFPSLACKVAAVTEASRGIGKGHCQREATSKPSGTKGIGALILQERLTASSSMGSADEGRIRIKSPAVHNAWEDS